MNIELKKDLEDIVQKFAFEEPNKVRREMRAELRKVLVNFSYTLDNSEIIIAQAGGSEINVDIKFPDGRWEWKVGMEAA